MRSETEQLRSAQANLILGGLTEALALDMGERMPRIQVAAVVFRGDTEEDGELLGAFAFDEDGDWLCVAHTAHLLSAGLHVVLERDLFGREDPGGELEDSEEQ